MLYTHSHSLLRMATAVLSRWPLKVREHPSTFNFDGYLVKCVKIEKISKLDFSRPHASQEFRCTSPVVVVLYVKFGTGLFQLVCKIYDWYCCQDDCWNMPIAPHVGFYLLYMTAVPYFPHFIECKLQHCLLVLYFTYNDDTGHWKDSPDQKALHSGTYETAWQHFHKLGQRCCLSDTEISTN